MLSKKYLNSVKNLNSIIRKMVTAPAPEKFTIEFLKNLGFPDSNDRAVIGLLKDLRFLTEGAVPTQRYIIYQETNGAGYVLNEALREAYSDIFSVNNNPSPVRNAAVRELFKNTHQVSDQLAGFMSNTFFSLLDMAQNNIYDQHRDPIKLPRDYEAGVLLKKNYREQNGQTNLPSLKYNIQIHLPVSRDIEIYHSIFKSLKEHLLDD
ncbi:MAG: DUF5343 domain-containing protein [Dinghuibacter sp.]|nr:DUF5343 domain-containing protein [Dinghuibacter sp.]